MQLEADERFAPQSSLSSLKFHPDFRSFDGNVVLAAKDATMYFRIHSHTLRTTSGFFRTMYSLPQYVETPKIEFPCLIITHTGQLVLYQT